MLAERERLPQPLELRAEARQLEDAREGGRAVQAAERRLPRTWLGLGLGLGLGFGLVSLTLSLSLSLSLTLTLTKAGEGADSSSEEREAERSPGTELKSRV